jgi:hypothetical protein
MKTISKNTSILSSLTLGIALLMSVTTHAEIAPKTHMVPVSVESLNFDQTNMMVTASGTMPNPCTAAPRPELRQTSKNAVLQLVVNGEMAGDVCVAVDMVGNSYELAFDIRSLKFNLSDINADTNGVYTIIGPNGKVLTEIDFSKVAFDLPFASHQMSDSKLAVMNDGRVVVAAGNSATFEVRSPFIDLKKYVGHTVDISGIVVDAHSSDFSLGRSQIERPLFLLTGLNTTTH